MKAPIVSSKHYVQQTITQVPTATVTTFELVISTNVPSVDAPADVEEGSVIKAIYLEYWIIGTFSLGSFVFTLEKVVQNGAAPTFSEMSTLFGYDNKKNILFTSQGLIAEDNQNPTPVVRGWFKIPKGKQRFGFRDKIRVSIASLSSEDLQICGFATYKAYR